MPGSTVRCTGQVGSCARCAWPAHERGPPGRPGPGFFGRRMPPEVNALVRRDDGWLLGMSDLLEPSCALSGEYDGALHREEKQHAADNVREEGFEHAGLV